MRPLSVVLKGCLALTLLSAPAFASDWQMDKGASTLEFEAKQGSTPFTGHFKDFDTEITLDPDNLDSAQIRAVIRTASVATGAADRDGALPGREWFNASNFPEAVFESDSVRHEGDNHYVAEGTLTLKGHTEPVTLPFTLDIAGDTAHAQGEVTINRLDYNVGEGDMAAAGVAGFEVTVKIDITATR